MSTIPATEILIDSKELAKRLGIHQFTVATLTRAGKIPAYRLGNEYRYSWDEVMTYAKFVPAKATGENS
jgi:excisionase family DNA binding protein